MSRLLVSVVIPTHNRAACLHRALESFGELNPVDGMDVEVIVVANACSDDTVASVERVRQGFALPLSVMEEPEPNLNIARNRGIAESRGAVVAFLDDDVWLESSWLVGLSEALATSAGVVAGRVRLWWESVARPEWMTARAERLLSWLDRGEELCDLEPPGALVGANFAVRRDVLDDIGGFLEGLDRSGSTLLSGGDTEFVLRARAAGHGVVYAPRMTLRHWVAPERVSAQYLAAVANGRGRTRAELLRLRHGRVPWPAVRVAAQQAVLGSCGRAWAGLVRSRARGLDHRLVAARGWGLLAAVAGKVRSGS